MEQTRRIVSPPVVLFLLIVPLTAYAGNLNADLLKAAEVGKTDVVQALIAKGADIDARGEDDWTALVGAARWGHTATVKALLEAGANVNAKSTMVEEGLFSSSSVEDVTALTYVKENSHTEIVQLLKKAGAKE
jgi:ankyrin repeat protein